MKQYEKGPMNAMQDNPSARPAVSREMERAPMAIGEHKNPYSSKLDMLGKGIITGVAVSTITQTGRTIARKMLKNPLVLFGLGLTAGFLLRKHRREIINTAGRAAEHGKEFVSRQQEKLKEVIAEARDAID